MGTDEAKKNEAPSTETYRMSIEEPLKQQVTAISEIAEMKNMEDGSHLGR